MLPATEPQTESHLTSSTFARVGLAVYTLLIIYASWYPFSGWQDIGVSPFIFLTSQWPRYWTAFDLLTNVLAYIPFGTLVVFAMYPKIRGIGAVLLTTVIGIALSGIMEIVQNFLPSRVPSNLDLFTNSSGTLIGAIIGIALSRTFLEESRLLQLRKAWFAHDAGRGLIVVALWPLAQIYPQGYLFGQGQILPILTGWLSTQDWLSNPIDVAGFLLNDQDLTVQDYWLSETIITACGLTGALLTLLCMMRKHSPKGRILLAAGITALSVKALATALLFMPDNAFSWLTPSAKGGVLVGAMMLSGLAFARPVVQRRLAVFSLLASVIVANIVPANPYFTATLQTWLQGKFLNFNGATHFLSLVWPFFALWFLLHPMHRVKRH